MFVTCASLCLHLSKDLLTESFISNDSFKTADSIETIQVRASEWTVESLIHSRNETACCYALFYKTNSTFVFTASRTCADIQKSTLLVQLI